jgi:hypothetical protein
MITVQSNELTLKFTEELASALSDGSLEGGLLPAVEEVGMEAETGGVTHREDPVVFASLEVELAGVVDVLVEQENGLDGVSRGAFTSIRVTDWVGHVRLVISRVEILAVPARREVNLETETIRAVLLRELRDRANATTLVVQADKVDGLVLHVGGVVLGAVRVAGDHAKTRREGDDLAVLAWTLQVVGLDERDRDGLEVTGLAAVKQSRRPVRAVKIMRKIAISGNVNIRTSCRLRRGKSCRCWSGSWQSPWSGQRRCHRRRSGHVRKPDLD